MEIVKIKKENIASYGHVNHEQTGTIAIDFANYLDHLNSIEGIDLKDVLSEGWYQVGFKFGMSLINNTDELEIKVVLSRRTEGEDYEFGYVSRTIKKDDFLRLIVNFTVQVSDLVHFRNDDISWSELVEIEQ